MMIITGWYRFCLVFLLGGLITATQALETPDQYKLSKMSLNSVQKLDDQAQKFYKAVHKGKPTEDIAASPFDETRKDLMEAISVVDPNVKASETDAFFILRAGILTALKPGYDGRLPRHYLGLPFSKGEQARQAEHRFVCYLAMTLGRALSESMSLSQAATRMTAFVTFTKLNTHLTHLNPQLLSQKGLEGLLTALKNSPVFQAAYQSVQNGFKPEGTKEKKPSGKKEKPSEETSSPENLADPEEKPKKSLKTLSTKDAELSDPDAVMERIKKKGVQLTKDETLAYEVIEKDMKAQKDLSKYDIDAFYAVWNTFKELFKNKEKYIRQYETYFQTLDAERVPVLYLQNMRKKTNAGSLESVDVHLNYCNPKHPRFDGFTVEEKVNGFHTTLMSTYNWAKEHNKLLDFFKNAFLWVNCAEDKERHLVDWKSNMMNPPTMDKIMQDLIQGYLDETAHFLDERSGEKASLDHLLVASFMTVEGAVGYATRLKFIGKELKDGTSLREQAIRDYLTKMLNWDK